MNLGVSEQAQRKKKDKKRSRKKKQDTKSSSSSSSSSSFSRRKIFQSKILKVEQRKIGLLIGPRGKNIKELYDRTRCDIITPRPARKNSDDEEYDMFMDGNFYYEYDAYDDTEKLNNKKINNNQDDEKQKSVHKNKDKNKKNDDDEDEEEED
eukprot:312181_1